MIARAAFTTEARSWLGVPFQHQGRGRAGVDCVGLVLCVAWALNVTSAEDVTGYRRAPDGTLLAQCDARMERCELADDPHVVALTFSAAPMHLAIVVPYRHGGLSLVHALSTAGRVVEHRFAEVWRARRVGAYRLPGVE